MNDRELNTDGPSPLESLVRPEAWAASDVPQDIIPQKKVLKEVKSRLAHKLANNIAMNEREMMWCVLQLTEALEEALRERMDANSMPPG